MVLSLPWTSICFYVAVSQSTSRVFQSQSVCSHRGRVRGHVLQIVSDALDSSRVSNKHGSSLRNVCYFFLRIRYIYPLGIRSDLAGCAQSDHQHTVSALLSSRGERKTHDVPHGFLLQDLGSVSRNRIREGMLLRKM